MGLTPKSHPPGGATLAFENLPNMYGDITIPQTVHNIDRRAFKKFAINAPDSKLGTLRIKGYSESNGNQHIIGYRLFSFARFKSVEIGGENSSVNEPLLSIRITFDATVSYVYPSSIP